MERGSRDSNSFPEELLAVNGCWEKENFFSSVVEPLVSCHSPVNQAQLNSVYHKVDIKVGGGLVWRKNGVIRSGNKRE